MSRMFQIAKETAKRRHGGWFHHQQHSLESFRPRLVSGVQILLDERDQFRAAKLIEHVLQFLLMVFVEVGPHGLGFGQ